MKALKEAYLEQQKKSHHENEVFQELYPELAPNLFQERTSKEQQQLIEKMDLEMAKLQLQMETLTPLMFQHFLQNMKPSALQPKPSQMLVSASPENLSRTIRLEANKAYEINGAPCLSMDKAEIVPLKITDCINQVDQQRRQLCLRFESTHPSTDLRQLNGRRLTLQLAGRYLETVGLWQALVFDSSEILLNGDTPLEIETARPPISDNPYTPLMQFFRQPEQLLKIEIWPLYFEEKADTFEIRFNFADSASSLSDIGEQHFHLNTFRMIQAGQTHAEPIEHIGCKLRYPIRLDDSESQLWKVEKAWASTRLNRHKERLLLNAPLFDGEKPYCQIINQYDQSFIEVFELKASEVMPHVISMDCLSYKADFECTPGTEVLNKGKAGKLKFKTIVNSCPSLPPHPQSFLDELNLLAFPTRINYNLEAFHCLVNAQIWLASHPTHHRHWASKLPFSITGSRTNKASRIDKEGLTHGLASELFIDDDYFPNTADADLFSFVMAYVISDIACLNNFHEVSTQQLKSGIQRNWKT